jgi:hypothetical protein
MKATKLAAGTAVLAPVVVGRGVGPAATDERVCRGTIGAVTVDNLRAPARGNLPAPGHEGRQPPVQGEPARPHRRRQHRPREQGRPVRSTLAD